MATKNIYNIPNALSFYRIAALPFIVYAIINGNREVFILLLSINLITDILDGLIARLFKLETALGAKLDSLADVGTYLMAFLGMIVLENEFVNKYQIPFVIIIGLWVLPQVITLIRFKRLPSFHLWSNKILGYIQGIFIFSYFVFGFSEWYFYFMIICSALAYLEELIIAIQIPVLASNLKSIFLLPKEWMKR